jgi:hypothetical protein
MSSEKPNNFISKREVEYPNIKDTKDADDVLIQEVIATSPECERVIKTEVTVTTAHDSVPLHSVYEKPRFRAEISLPVWNGPETVKLKKLPFTELK